ncbi:MAG: TorF family putative porin [Caulobacteraceae bacterium]
MAALTALALICAAPSRAQIAASASIVSNDIYRGISLSDGQPALTVNLAWDDRSGAYAGIGATGEVPAGYGPRLLGHTEYAGFARRAGVRATWDVGVSHAEIVAYYDRPYRYSETEVYAGVRARDLSLYIYWSPHYYRPGVHALYLDLSASRRLAPRLRLFGHVGLLSPSGGPGDADARRAQVDLRAGVAAEFTGGELDLTASAARPGEDYLGGSTRMRNALTLGASFFF